MKVVSAEFMTSAVSQEQYPTDARPEIALVGRSNVGKSSFINRMTGRKKLARTSGTPGKTQLLNFYLINEAFYFVDLPGYGYAQVSKQTRAAWGKMIERYLLHRDNLRGVVQFIDIRHPPTKDDITMFNWLEHYGVPTILVATKADKISKNRRQKHLKNISQPLNNHDVYVFSSLSGEGVETVWDALRTLWLSKTGNAKNGDSE